jgi:chloride channel protein, CIC family
MHIGGSPENFVVRGLDPSAAGHSGVGMAEQPSHMRSERLVWPAVGQWTCVLVLAASLGAAVSAFEWLFIEQLVRRVIERPWWIGAGLAVVGLVVTRVVLAGRPGALGDRYIAEITSSAPHIDLVDVPRQAAAFTASTAAALPIGIEAAMLYFGASGAQRIAPRFTRVPRSSLLAAAAAAAVAALFANPAAAALLAIEVPHRWGARWRLAGPATLGALAGWGGGQLVHSRAPLLFAADRSWDRPFVAYAAVVGALAALGSQGFVAALRAAKQHARHRAALPVAAIALVVLAAVSAAIAGDPVALGGGLSAIDWATTSSSAAAVLGVVACRTLATPIATLGGAVGGVFVPVVAIGALCGIAAATVLGAPAGLFAVAGAAATLASAYRVPLSGLALAAAAAGLPGFVLAVVAVAVALVCAPERSVFDQQGPSLRGRAVARLLAPPRARVGRLRSRS